MVLRDVEKAFGEHEVLKGFSLEVTEGEILCLLGGSGSGKSVTLKIVNGLLRPDAGEVWVCGREIGSGDAEALAEVRARLGMNFQSDALLKGLTVFENVALPLRETTDLEESEIAERVRARLELLGVAEAAEKLPEELSGGMRKRVGLARAVVRQDEVQLVLYDEPTAGLDPISKDSVHQMIDELRELELTQIVVTHDLETVRQLADRVGVLHEGSSPP
ncbi:MAG: ATP-binding cassette domain-containing protein [Planctomycetota bacterium]